MATTKSKQDTSISNPWKGLNFYKEGEILYGRDDEIQSLSLYVTNNIQTVLYGKSGIGKSSIINAGVFPIARKEGLFPIPIRLKHDKDTSYIAQIKVAFKESGIGIREILPAINEQNESLWEYLHRHLFFNVVTNESVRPLIVLDQFEEIFTLQQDENKKKNFFSELANLLNEVTPQYIVNANIDNAQSKNQKTKPKSSAFVLDLGSNDEEESEEYVSESLFNIVFTIREDFLSYLERYTKFIPVMKSNRYALLPLNEEQAKDIIMSPIPGLVDIDVAKLIIQKVTARTDFNLNDAPEIDVDAAVLSLYLSRLYDKKGEESSTITAELVDVSSKDIIKDFYEESVYDLPISDVEKIEDQLLTYEGRRNNVSRNDIIRDGVSEETLHLLVEDKKLLRQFSYQDDIRIEFMHDILCPIVNDRIEHREQLAKEREEQKKREEEEERRKKEEAEENARREIERQIQEEKLRKAEEEKQILLRKQKLQEEENLLLKRKQEEELARAERETMHQQEQLERAEKERKLLLRQQELQEEENRMLVLKQEEERRRQEREKQELQEKNKQYQKKVKRNRLFFLIVAVLAVIASPFIYNYVFPPEQWQLLLVEDQTVGSENYWKAEVSILNETSDTLYPVQTLDKSHFQTAYPSHRNNKVRIVIQFLAGNFSTIDTVVDVRDSLTIPISRAHGRIKYEGKVIGSDSGQPIKNAVVIVGGQITKTNNHGFFTLFVERSDISNDGTIKIYKSGYGLIDTKMGNGVPNYMLKADDPKAFANRRSMIEKKIAFNGFEMIGEIAGKSCHLRASIMKDSIWGSYYYNKTMEDIKEKIRKDNKNEVDTIHAEIIFTGKVNKDKSFHLDCCDWVYNIEELNGRINEDNSWEGYWHSYSPNLQKFKFVVLNP